MSVATFEVSDGIAVITLNRPEAENAINPELHARLKELWGQIETDDDIDNTIVTGTGDASCAGADLKSYMNRWPGASPEAVRANVADGLGGLTRGMHRHAKPTIAAVNGWALAGGFETALAARAQIIARQILRNDQTAVRSAKQVILEMVGRRLDDQLNIEALAGYSVASRPEVPERLQAFYGKTDAGRHGKYATAL